MRGQDCEQLTLFREDFPASRFPWLESKKEKGMTVTYGRKCSELSENLRRVGSSVRTYLESCELPPGMWSRTWSVKDMTSRCLILKLRLSERHTGERESPLLPTGRLWPTPCATEARQWLQIRREGKKGTQQSLSTAVKLWPTPSAAIAKGTTGGNRRCDLRNSVLYPTPTTGAGMCGGTGNFQQLQKLKDCGAITEEERRNMSQGNGGQLNPTWVEAMMGFPISWTELED